MLPIKPSAELTLATQESLQTLSPGPLEDQEPNPMLLGGLHQLNRQYQGAREGQDGTLLQGLLDMFPDGSGQPGWLPRPQKGIPLLSQSGEVNAVTFRPTVDLDVEKLQIFGNPPSELRLP